MKLGQFSAWISVDGVALTELATEYSPDRKEASCWIPSEQDKQFCVHFENDKPSPSICLSGRTYVDGIRCGGRRLRIRRSGNVAVSSGSRDSVSTSEYTRRPLVFGKQALTDDDAYLNTPISPDFGSIKVTLRQVAKAKLTEFECKRHESPPPLHERSKKALGHSIKLGAEFKSKRNRMIQDRPIKTFVNFTFKYRPIELLRAEGIAPPEQAQARTASSSEILDLTLDTDDEGDMAAEIERLEARVLALKERSKRTGPIHPRIKREMKTEESSFKAGEIIDLT
ncbi:hypothetical protein GGX14DRAFT_474608 [Mycena pura]|uniref:DUF7918 domain-containing protein n=1 Tax=Mycena pura TaxID=153505 RepID=A0AAD6UVI8_9AGAR|nr:hypothetical protein GGX14DRAFT_474608 [Mycena pura]